MNSKRVSTLFKMVGLCLFLVTGFSCSQDSDEDLNGLNPKSEGKLNLKVNKDLYGKADATRKSGKGNKVSDAFSIKNVEKEGNILKVTVSYSGGCAEHKFNVIWGGEVLLSHPCQINLVLTHNAQDDACETQVTETLEIDLEELIGNNQYRDTCKINVFSILNRSDSPDGSISNDED